MTANPPITISREELRNRVEEYIDTWIPDDLWQRAEMYALHKFGTFRERFPEEEHYNNEYLIILTADTVREIDFKNRTNAVYQLMKE